MTPTAGRKRVDRCPGPERTLAPRTTQDPRVLLGAQLLLTFGAVTANVVTSVLLSEIFPTAVRYTASAVTYNVSYAVFGGTAPFVSTLLVDATGSRLSPAVYITVISALALVAALSLPETSGRPLSGIRPPAGPRDRPADGPARQGDSTAARSGSPD